MLKVNINVRRTLVGGLFVAAGGGVAVRSDVDDLRDDLDNTLTSVV